MNQSTSTLTKEKYIRAVTRKRKDDYLTVAIPTKLSKRMNLDHNSYVSIDYIDKLNQLVFRKIQEV
jgi:hypothetical protein